MFRKKCEHEWHETKRVQVKGLFNITEMKVYAYCPKCDKRESASEKDWDLVKAEQDLRIAYRNSLTSSAGG